MRGEYPRRAPDASRDGGGGPWAESGGPAVGSGPGRIEVIAGLLILGGATMCARGFWRLAQSIRARATYGAPYRRGTIPDRLLGLLLEIPVLVLGLALGWLALGQASFQPNERTVRVGQVEARRMGWGKVGVRFIPDPLYPLDTVLEGEISGARWAMAGDFIAWDGGVKWLGFRDGHRLRYLIGTNDTTGLTPASRGDRAVLEPLPAIARRLVGLDRYLPFLTVRTETSPWFTLADRQVMILYAIGPGYLADVASEGRSSSSPTSSDPRGGG